MAKKKEYSNGEVTVIWQPEICMHSGICFRGLPSVFQPRVRPWIKIDAASTEEIVNQVKACPSRALSYYRNAEENEADESNLEESLNTEVEVLKNGPLLIRGTLKVIHRDGREEIRIKRTTFCRCGGSNNKPYCDGRHNKNGFNG